MRCSGTSSIHQLLGDRLLFRDLQPIDPGLPGIDELRPRLGLEPGRIPRKSEPIHARIVAEILRAAAGNRGSFPLRYLLMVGDTQRNDVLLFRNLCEATGWEGRAFIGCEDSASPEPDPLTTSDERQDVVFASRWASLAAFQSEVAQDGLGLDERTIVIVDIDKTLIGARGRNDHAIDAARLEAARRTASDVLGSAAVPTHFEDTYHELNRPEWHPFTSDDQDVVVLLTSLVAADLAPWLQTAAHRSAVPEVNLRGLLEMLDSRRLPSAATDLIDKMLARIDAGAPTLLPEFREAEFAATVARMGQLADDATPEELLQEEIVLTAEVLTAVMEWQRRGCTVFGVSDKPPEACFPGSNPAGSRPLPLHQTITHVVGEDRAGERPQGAPDRPRLPGGD